MKRADNRIWQQWPARSRSGSRPGGVVLIEVPAGVSLPAADSALRVFFSSEIEKLANESGALGTRRRICVARVRISRGGDKIVLSWQVISVSDGVFRKLRELAGEERDGAIDAIADILEEPLWKLLADSWNTSDPGDFGVFAEAVSALQATLKSYLIGDPAKLAGSALGLADLSLLEAIAERVPIPGIDKSLDDIRHYAEIAGIMLVVLTGGHILACAPFKLWVHDKLGQLLAKLIDTFLRELGAKPAGRSSPAEPDDRRPRPPGGPAHPPPGPPPDTPPGPDGPDRSPPGCGPPSPLSSGSAGRSFPPAGPGQVRPDPPAHRASGSAPRQPATAREATAPAAPDPRRPKRTRVHGPRAIIGERHGQDRDELGGGRAPGEPAQDRRPSTRVEPGRDDSPQLKADGQREEPPEPMSTPSELDIDRPDGEVHRHGHVSRRSRAAGIEAAPQGVRRADGNPRPERHRSALSQTPRLWEAREYDAVPRIPSGRVTSGDKPWRERSDDTAPSARPRDLPSDRGREVGRAETDDGPADWTTGMRGGDRSW